MFEINILNIETNKTFSKIFYSEITMNKFLNKIKYSKKIKLLSINDYTKFYD